MVGKWETGSLLRGLSLWIQRRSLGQIGVAGQPEQTSSRRAVSRTKQASAQLDGQAERKLAELGRRRERGADEE